MKAVVDAQVCIGCELCVGVCPQVFQMQNDLGVVKVDPVPPEAQACAREAEESCPVTAIHLEE